jgi:hypothetical protein
VDLYLSVRPPDAQVRLGAWYATAGAQVEQGVLGLELEHRDAGRVGGDDQLAPAVQVNLGRSVVSPEAEIPLVALGAEVEHGRLGIELEHLPALAVDDGHLT